ncbi:MAG TPA: hypothetical protein VNW97_03660 [Candidatus Saccharimonadales bacterium]|nr:hypothetical protein [Candidatus Saccharimonadales bacterium]
MAESKVTRKFNIYRHLYHINSAFRYLETNLEMLLANELLEHDGADVWRSRLGELQAEINMKLTGRLHQQESGEIRRLGPMVEEWEEGEIAKATARARKKKSVSKKR